MRCSFAREASLHEPPAYFSCVRISGGTRRSVGGSAHVSATATYRVPSDTPSAARSIGSGLVVLPAPVLASSLSSHSTLHRRCEVTGVESRLGRSGAEPSLRSSSRDLAALCRGCNDETSNFQPVDDDTVHAQESALGIARRPRPPLARTDRRAKSAHGIVVTVQYCAQRSRFLSK